MTREEALEFIAQSVKSDVDMAKVADAIKALEPRWIPVEEKLPEIHNYTEKYLVTLERGWVRTAMCTQCDGKHWWTYDDVVAWMPLPQPYSEVKE